MATPTIRTNPYQGLTKEQVLTTMRKLLAEEKRNPFLMGQLHNYVADSRLLEGTQYKTAVDFFRGNIQGISRANLLRDGAVAREFNEVSIARFGAMRLQQLLAYKEATRITLDPDDPGAAFIVVPQDNGELKPQRFAGCTTKELRKALEHARSPNTYLPLSKEEQAHYELLREAILSRWPEAEVMIHNDGGQTLLDFKTIPVSDVEEFLMLLRDISPEQKDDGGEEPPRSH
jgi:hypothetical protein